MMMNEAVTGPLAPAQRTLPEMLQYQAAQFGPRPLLRIAGHQWTHDDAAQAAALRASALSDAGVQRGDRVALMSGNRIEFLQTFLGAGWIGALSVPINTASMGPQIGYFLADSQARLLVIEAEFFDRLEAADLERSALREIWVLGGAGSADSADRASGIATADQAGSKWQPSPGIRVLPCPAATRTAVPAAVRPGDPLAILYTSGTTGPAKGVVCPHAQYYWWGVNSAQVLDVGPDDVLCTTLPLFHINALNTFAQAALLGCEVVFESRFSASGFWPSMRESGATVVYLLGAMVPILLAQPAGPHERDHKVRLGLGPGVPADAGRRFLQRTGVRLLEGYGSTETNFAIATAPDAPRSGVMGWVLPGFQARVADEDDVEVAAGVAGELLLRADEPYAFASGYFNMPEKTVEAWRNLWFHSGDRVVRDADGALRFVDRIKDAIRRRGENISSFEVEQVLLSHPGIAACAVYPVRSELAEDEVMAALVPRSGIGIDLAELVAFCAVRLPYFAVPRYIDLLADLPRTANGKVQKYRLRERGVTSATWDGAGTGRQRVGP
jgi:crotonobetaine/carnitine-CoA ligase